jgi:sugar lactone lactonase YvrE
VAPVRRRPAALAAFAAALAVACPGGASSAPRVRVTLVARPPSLVVGQAWTARLAVRPEAARGPVRLLATGPGHVEATATGTHGSYRARLVLRRAGRWSLVARVGGTTARLGTVLVRNRAPRPVVFAWPTSVAVEPDGSLLVVENGTGHLLRVDPASGSTSVVATLPRAYGVALSPSGDPLVSAGAGVFRIDQGGAVSLVAPATDAGPIVAAPGGDVYFTTGDAVFRLVDGAGPAQRVAAAAGPHGLAVAADGALLISDTGNGRILRLDAATGAVTTLAQVDDPRGLAVAADGSILVVDATARRVLRLDAQGATLGYLGPALGDPYALALGPAGSVYVVDTAAAGFVRRIAADGAVATVSRR